MMPVLFVGCIPFLSPSQCQHCLFNYLSFVCKVKESVCRGGREGEGGGERRG